MREAPEVVRDIIDLTDSAGVLARRCSVLIAAMHLEKRAACGYVPIMYRLGWDLKRIMEVLPALLGKPVEVAIYTTSTYEKAEEIKDVDGEMRLWFSHVDRMIPILKLLLLEINTISNDTKLIELARADLSMDAHLFRTFFPNYVE